MQQDDLIAEAKEFFEFHKKEIGKSSREGKKSIMISFQDLASHSPQLTEILLHRPEETLQLLDVALDETNFITNGRVRLLDLPTDLSIKIRELRAKHLGQFIVIEGIIRQASDVRPQVVNAKFECPNCGTILSVLQVDKHFCEPKRCSCGRKGNFTLIAKEMVDAQRIVVEESPESLEGGEQPRRINVFLKEDLVEPKMERRTTPGAKVRVIGVLKEVPIPLKTGAISTRFDLAIEANNVFPLEETFEELDISEEDEKKFRELASDPDLYSKIRRSIAPSIYGYEKIREALALQLLGGIRKEKSDGTFARGDIHVLLVGDPGVAKSVMLKFISTIAPKGRYISGRQATGAGLTAVVIRDEFLRGWSIEAGAMVLAHKGIACIDELEDMTPEDRSAMHEALEQQTVSVSKANVQSTLKAETSVLAAANPKLGRFDILSPIPQQINIDPALLNRFDLIFIIQDRPERVKDEAIATHILSEHKKIPDKPPIEPGLLRKYIAYAKQNFSPELSEEAAEEINKFYVDLRNSSTSIVVEGGRIKPIPITPRQLEALIRVSEAYAKARLSKKVTRDDTRRAIELIKYYLGKAGYDYSTGQPDIDMIATGLPTSQRSAVILVRETIKKLESRFGNLIPIEELVKEISEKTGGKIDLDFVEDAIEKLTRSGDIFEPKKGFIQRIY